MISLIPVIKYSSFLFGTCSVLRNLAIFSVVLQGFVCNFFLFHTFLDHVLFKGNKYIGVLLKLKFLSKERCVTLLIVGHKVPQHKKTTGLSSPLDVSPIDLQGERT